MPSRIRILATLALLLVPTAAWSQRPLTDHTLTRAEGQPAPRASIEDVAWIAGHWQGEALGGISEEIWSRPRAGSMMGVYRLVRNGAVVFYEILSLAPEGESLVLTLKHFNPDLTGWEEKDETVRFPLVRITPEAAYFDGMTFRRLEEGGLQIFLALRREEGGVREVEFLYHRADGSPAPVAAGGK